MGFKRKFKRTLNLTMTNEIYAHMTMTYECNTCGESTVMYLEQGLEDASVPAKYHKPVPFAILCPRCKKGSAYHIHWHLDKHFNNLVKKDKSTINYFADKRGEECGVPVFNGKEEHELC